MGFETNSINVCRHSGSAALLAAGNTDMSCSVKTKRFQDTANQTNDEGKDKKRLKDTVKQTSDKRTDWRREEKQQEDVVEWIYQIDATTPGHVPAQTA